MRNLCVCLFGVLLFCFFLAFLHIRATKAKSYRLNSAVFVLCGDQIIAPKFLDK